MRYPNELCGRDWFDAVFRLLDSRVTITWLLQDGEWLQPDTIVCRLEGPARAINTGERTALNFLQTLSGTATAAEHRLHVRAAKAKWWLIFFLYGLHVSGVFFKFS